MCGRDTSIIKQRGFASENWVENNLRLKGQALNPKFKTEILYYYY